MDYLIAHKDDDKFNQFKNIKEVLNAQFGIKVKCSYL